MDKAGIKVGRRKQQKQQDCHLALTECLLYTKYYAKYFTDGSTHLILKIAFW